MDIIEKAVNEMVKCGHFDVYWPTPIQFKKLCQGVMQRQKESQIDDIPQGVPMPDDMRNYFKDLADKKRVID